MSRVCFLENTPPSPQKTRERKNIGQCHWGRGMGIIKSGNSERKWKKVKDKIEDKKGDT
jgi:hypothetical protein